MTDYAEVDPADPSSEVVATAAEVLRRGGTVAFPTETVYGLGADALSADAVTAVYRAKGRPASDPVIVHLADAAALDAVACDVPGLARRLARRFWPGPLTLVLRRSAAIPDVVTAGRDTVGVRVPRHPVALALIEAAGIPLAAPSANRFGRISPTTARHVRQELDGRIDMVIDGGPCPVGVESTVVSLVGEPEVLRPGGVTLEDLREEVPDLRYRRRVTSTAPTSPGLLLRHYAPNTPLLLVEGDPGPVLAQLAAAGLRAELVLSPADRPQEPATVAHDLYARLRSLDEASVDVLLAVTVAEEGLGAAVNDRLYRAAEGRVVDSSDPGAVERVVTTLRPRS